MRWRSSALTNCDSETLPHRPKLLVTGFDLGNNIHQQHILQYITKCMVLVVLMAPSCRTLGPTSNLNYHLNYDTWLKHYQEDMPHVHFCGRVAWLETTLQPFFFAENPWPTHLIHEGCWPKVLEHADIEVIHQCMLGQKGPHNLPSKKPTACICNSKIMLSLFANIRCNGKHQHDTGWGHSGALAKQQVWPWQFAELVIEGIVQLIKAMKKANAYPAFGTGPSDEPAPDSEERPWMKCPGCKGRMARGRREHTRAPGVS